MLLCMAIVHTFSLMYSILLYDYTTINYYAVDGYLGWFQLLAITNHAAMIIVYESSNVMYITVSGK